MTTDAPRSNAEQWHIPPQDRRLGEGMSPIPEPAPFVDLEPLILHFERELQRARDQLAVERTAASSAREALAACEERARVLGTQHELSKMALEHAKQGEASAQRMLLDERKRVAEMQSAHQGLVDEYNRRTDERDVARAQLERAKTVPPGLVPGTTLAVIEAYRLITGHEPHHDGESEWFDSEDESLPAAGPMYDQALQLLCWLDRNAPGGRP